MLGLLPAVSSSKEIMDIETPVKPLPDTKPADPEPLRLPKPVPSPFSPPDWAEPGEEPEPKAEDPKGGVSV